MKSFIFSFLSLAVFWNNLMAQLLVEVKIDQPIDCLVTSIASEETVLLHPNPANNRLVLPSMSLGQEIRIYDSGGQLVERLDRLEENELDVSKLKGGLYLMMIGNAKNVRRTKFIIKK